MKRLLSILSVLALLIALAACGGAPASTPASPPAPAPSASPSAEAPPERELGDLLVIYSSATDGDLDALTEGFNRRYPDITIEIVTCSAGECIARVRAESGAPQADIIYSGLNQADGDSYADCFEPYISIHEDEILDAYKSDNGYYNYDHLSTAVFCVNTEEEKKLGMEIKGYQDLVDPRLKGKIVFSDPNSSSAAWNNVSGIMAALGYDSQASWDLIQGLFDNDIVISGSSSACFKTVADGEYTVGLTYEDGASTLIKQGSDNIRMVYPEEGASSFAFAAAIVKNAPHMEAAKAMIDYLQSADGQSERAAALGTVRFTNAKATAENSFLPAYDTVNWVIRDIPWLIENKEQVLAHWSSLVTKD